MKVAILTNWPRSYSTTAVAEAFEKQDHDVHVLTSSRCYVKLAYNTPSVHYNGSDIPAFDVVMPRLTPSGIEYGSTIVRQFEMMNTYTTISSLALQRANDKLRSMQLLTKAGISIPKTAFARKSADIDSLLELVGGPPVIIKLIESSQGEGVVLAETKKAAKSVIEAFYQLKANILVQEYIEESGGEDIRALVAGGKVIAAMKRKSGDQEFRSNLHKGGSAERVKLTKDEKRVAIKSMKKLGLRIAGVDILQSERGPLVIEVNATPGLEGIERVTGINVAKKIASYVGYSAKGTVKKDKIGA